VSQPLLQPPDIDPVPDYVDGEAMAETMRVHELADHHPIPLHQLPGPLLDMGKGRIARDGMFSHVVTQLSQRYHIKREPPLRAALRLHDIDHVIVVFDVLEPQVQQFIDADS
jgi:hypothetical protein